MTPDYGAEYEHLQSEAELRKYEGASIRYITRTLLVLSLLGPVSVDHVVFLLGDKWTLSDCINGELSPKSALEEGEVFTHCFLPKETRTDLPDKGLVTFTSADKTELWVLRAENEVPWDSSKCCCADCYPQNGLR